MISVGPRLSGAFVMCVPEMTPETPSEEVRSERVAVVRSARALLAMTRGETHPAVLYVRKTAFRVIRRAYRAIRLARHRQRWDLMSRYVVALRIVALAGANWTALTLSQRSITLDPASLS